jgi:sugar porter (SP) family MFS transporter
VKSSYVWKIAISAAFGGLLFGYDWVVIGGARQFYEQYFHLASAAQIGWANSCALVGCLLGSLVAGSLSSHYGRRKALLLSAVIFCVSSTTTGWAHSFSVFILSRIAGGMAIGLSSNVSPLYISEISPAAVRGRLVSLYQFAIVIGILMAQVVDWLIARPIPTDITDSAVFASWNVQYGWRWMFTAISAPAFVFIFTSLFLPESPRWLLVKNHEDEARTILERLGGDAYAHAEIQAIENAVRAENAERLSAHKLLTRGVGRMLFIGIGLAVLQQWSGINVLFNYAEEVYRSAGYATNDIFVNIIITGAINLIFTVLAMTLVDRIGRRPLILFGCFGIGIAHLLSALAYHAHWNARAVLIFTLSAIGCYALTLAPVTWVLISEIFPNEIRSQAVSVCVTALWAASFLLTYSFPVMNKDLGTRGAFLAYGIICILGGLMNKQFLPETKGRPLEQIEIHMR